MDCCCATESDLPVTIVSEENRHCHVSRECGGLGAEADCPSYEESSLERHAVAALPALTQHLCQTSSHADDGTRSSATSLSDLSADEPTSLPFSKEVIAFSLFGRIHPKCKRPWNESLSARIAEVQECYKNIPPKLYFSPSSVSLEGIGVYAAELLPQDTSLGPYIGHHVSREHIDKLEHNQWLWEVYDNNSLAYFIDASDPKLSNHNWMNFIQCARNSTEQNLKLTQINESLYFVATRDISIGEELLVWYDEVQYGVYMGLPTRFSETPSPFIEAAAMEPGVGHGHSAHTSTATAAYTTHSHTAAVSHALSRNQSEQRLYVQYLQQPSSASGLSDSASTDDSGISLSLEHSGGGGPTPPGGGGGALTYSFDRVSNSSGSSTHLDVTSTAGKHLQSEPVHHQSQLHEVALYQGGEVYHVAMPTGGSPISQQTIAVSGGGVTCSPHWVGVAGAGKGDLTGGEVWLKSSSAVALSQHVSLAGGSLGNRKQLLYGMFSRYEDGTRWQCEECKKLFSSQGSLRAHARIHTGERPYQCQYCCRTFCQASTLRSHERLHTGEKPYKCEHCGRAFTQSAGLRSHLKTHRYDS